MWYGNPGVLPGLVEIFGKGEMLAREECWPSKIVFGKSCSFYCSVDDNVNDTIQKYGWNQEHTYLRSLQRRFRKFLYDSLNSHRKDSHLFHAFRRANRHKVRYTRTYFNALQIAVGLWWLWDETETWHSLINAIAAMKILMAEIHKSQSKSQWAQLRSGVFSTRTFNSTHRKYEVK